MGRDLDHLYKFSFPFQERFHINFGFHWPSGFRGKDFENNCNTHVYTGSHKQAIPMGPIIFQKHTSVNLVKYFPLNEYVTVFPIQMHRRPNLTLP